mmetsp:Transcript_81399/g.264233  ORF Transcript_81399/g.264233 Transcript_81399/m.264233 type:complete len:245 (+) Transcript_81399:2523-3257(+)
MVRPSNCWASSIEPCASNDETTIQWQRSAASARAVFPELLAMTFESARRSRSRFTKSRRPDEATIIRAVRPLLASRALGSAAASSNTSKACLRPEATQSMRGVHPESDIASGSALFSSRARIKLASRGTSAAYTSKAVAISSAAANSDVNFEVDSQCSTTEADSSASLHREATGHAAVGLKIEKASPRTPGRGSRACAGNGLQEASSSNKSCQSSRTGSSLCSEIWHQRRQCRSHSPIANVLPL